MYVSQNDSDGKHVGGDASPRAPVTKGLSDSRRRSPWQVVRRMLLIVLGCYLFVFAMLYAFQRSLTYFPSKQARVDPREAGLAPGQVHSISVQADDGVTLHGWHVLPSGRMARDARECDEALADARWVVLYFSGNAGHRGYRGLDCELLASSGCHVFLFDYRGYGENAGEPNEEALAADARSVWDYATVERRVSADRLLLFGESLGGGVAVRLASEKSIAGAAPGGLILRSTFSSLVDAAAYHYPWLPVRWAMHERYPSAERIGQVTCPILQVHGRADTIVPIALARQLFEAAPARSASGIAKRFLPLDGADHNDVLEVAGLEFGDAIRGFLKELASVTGKVG